MPTHTVSPSAKMRLTFLLPTRKCVNFCVASAPTLPSRCGAATGGWPATAGVPDGAVAGVACAISGVVAERLDAALLRPS